MNIYRPPIIVNGYVAYQQYDPRYPINGAISFHDPISGAAQIALQILDRNHDGFVTAKGN